MPTKSDQDRYGAVAVAIHWLTAVLIVAVLAAGFVAANSVDVTTKIITLRFHLLGGIAVFLLTGLRLAWWLFADRRPRAPAGLSQAQLRVRSIIHVLFYVVPLGMVASGFIMVASTNAAAIIFGGAFGPLPQFAFELTRRPHGVGALILLALLAAHIGAALNHQFVKRDGLMRRMSFLRS